MLTENDFNTELPDGEEVPVRFLGVSYIVGYGYIEPDEFLLYAEKLWSAEDDGDLLLEEDDVVHNTVNYIDFDEITPRIEFGHGEDAIDITYVVMW